MIDNGVRLLPVDDDSWRLEAYLLRGGYDAARKAQGLPPRGVIQPVAAPPDPDKDAHDGE